MYAAVARSLSESLTVPTPRTHAQPRPVPLLEVAPNYATPSYAAPSFAPSLPEARAAYQDARDWHSQAVLIGLLGGLACSMLVSRRAPR